MSVTPDGRPLSRRPIRARETRWAAWAAARLGGAGVTPNAVSLASLVAAALAGGCLLLSRTGDGRARAALLVAAAVLIQVRLLCNLLDGMIAIEGGRRTAHGELFNELPDRASDVIVLVCAGYASPLPAWSAPLGWAAAVLAVLTAYVRAFGGALTGRQDFCGPMAKAHRMAVVTAASLLAAAEAALARPPVALPGALAVVVLGCLVTLARRIRRIARDLARRA